MSISYTGCHIIWIPKAGFHTVAWSLSNGDLQDDVTNQIKTLS